MTDRLAAPAIPPSETAPVIRDAAEADLPAICAIYNHAIATTTATFHEQPSTLDEQREAMLTKQHSGYPVLVAELQGQIAGFGSYGGFRHQWNAYRYSIEHSVYVDDAVQGRGLATSLLNALIDHGTQAGFHVMIGGIEATNAKSLALHTKLGFEQVALFREVGFKFGRWLDLVFMQKFLKGAGHDPRR